MTTDWKALCAELVAIEDVLSGGGVQFSNQGQALDGYSALANFRDVAARACAALAQPEPEGPTKAELRQIFDDQSGFINDEQVMWWSDFQHAARAVLARWGRPTPQPPVAGEVAAALIELRSTVMGLDQMKMYVAAQRVKRAAALLSRLSPPQPIPVSERLPGPEDNA